MKKIIAIVLCICTLSVLLLTGCTNLKAKEQTFVDCYNSYAKEYFEKPETVIINSITEYVDEKGGSLVVFSYECTTSVGYKEQGRLCMVTSKITLDASLITLHEELSGFAVWLTEHNGKSLDVGFVDKENSLTGDEGELLLMWQAYQAEQTRTNYSINRINKELTGNKAEKKQTFFSDLIDKIF